VKNSDEYLSTLVELGLSVPQAKIYLALAKSCSLKVQEISTSSGVARPDVYRVLIKLEEAGFIERTISTPQEFCAVPFEKCVSNLVQIKMNKTAELHQKVLKLTQEFRQNVTVERPNEKFHFMLLPSKRAIYAKSQEMLQEVQTIIEFLSLTRRMIAWLSNYTPCLEAALARKVECRVIMPKPEPHVDVSKHFKRLKRYSNFSLTFLPEEPKFGFSVWDNKEVLITTAPIDSPTPATTLWSNNRAIVDLCHEHFEYLWTKAEKADLIV
jgi:sugar-specific transcriptional regulator TrmB